MTIKDYHYLKDPVTEWIADIIRHFDDDKASIREILNSALSKPP